MAERSSVKTYPTQITGGMSLGMVLLNKYRRTSMFNQPSVDTNTSRNINVFPESRIPGHYILSHALVGVERHHGLWCINKCGWSVQLVYHVLPAEAHVRQSQHGAYQMTQTRRSVDFYVKLPHVHNKDNTRL